MKILVGIKHVPDTETKIKVATDGKSIDEAGIKWIISPYDEYALEQALLIKEATGEGEVILVCAGRETAQATLRQGLAMGADRAILIADAALADADGLARSRALAAVARQEQVQLVLVGKYGVGMDEWQTGPMLAETLDWPHVSAVARFDLDGTRFKAARSVEGGLEVHEGSLPAVISCEKGLNKPRLTSLKGIMQAKKKPIEQKSAAEFELPAAGAGPRIVIQSIELPAGRAGAQLIEGEAREAAASLADRLRQEAKVI